MCNYRPTTNDNDPTGTTDTIYVLQAYRGGQYLPPCTPTQQVPEPVVHLRDSSKGDRHGYGEGLTLLIRCSSQCMLANGWVYRSIVDSLPVCRILV